MGSTGLHGFCSISQGHLFFQKATYCGWLRNPFRARLKPWLKPLFTGIYRGIISPGCLRWFEIDFDGSLASVPSVQALLNRSRDTKAAMAEQSLDSAPRMEAERRSAGAFGSFASLYYSQVG